MQDDRGRALRSLPAVSALLNHDRVVEASHGIDSRFVTAVVRKTVDDERRAILAGEHAGGRDLAELVARELDIITGANSNLVINGTGVVIQTNLGRAPVSTETAKAMADAATSYLALETDLATGERGGRGARIEAMVRALTGAERTLVVNNNAAAVLLTLAATSAGRSVVVSRGEAVEIGGGFRVPDVLRESGAQLVEVGTTNRTYLRDYAAAVDETTAAFLRVHASNFALVGFVTRPDLADLAELAHDRGVLAIEDVGSGCLLDTSRYGLAHEPTLGESIAAGVDVVCASGDKLLGGPQAGLVIGRADVVDRIRQHPLARALRADKTCLAGIEATLLHYLRGDAEQAIPIWWSISRAADWLESRARGWAAQIGERANVIPTESVVGGGSLPGRSLPSFALTLASDRPVELAARLRTGTPHVFPRIVDDAVAIDARTVLPNQDEQVIQAVLAALAS